MNACVRRLFHESSAQGQGMLTTMSASGIQMQHQLSRQSKLRGHKVVFVLTKFSSPSTGRCVLSQSRQK
jgi:hypothetical protein